MARSPRPSPKTTAEWNKEWDIVRQYLKEMRDTDALMRQLSFSVVARKHGYNDVHGYIICGCGWTGGRDHWLQHFMEATDGR